MADIIAWVVAHWGDLVGILIGLLTVASAITALTPSPRDDEVVRKVLAFLSFLQPKGTSKTVKAPMTRPEEPLIVERTRGEPRETPEDPRTRLRR